MLTMQLRSSPRRATWGGKDKTVRHRKPPGGMLMRKHRLRKKARKAWPLSVQLEHFGGMLVDGFFAELAKPRLMEGLEWDEAARRPTSTPGL